MTIPKASITAFTLAALIILSLTPATATAPSLNYVYALDDKGLARVTVIISNLTGFIEYSFSVHEQVVNESLIAFDESGNIVLANYNGTHITVYPYNTTDKVIVQFNAIVGTLENSIITAVIHPYGPATITLPDNAGLLYFNDTPEIEIIGNTIKLYFNKSAGYEIQYIVVNETTPTTTTSPTTSPTTTTTTASTTTTTVTTTSVPTTTTITQTTTTQTTTTSPTITTQTSSTQSTISTSPTTTQTIITTTSSPSTITTTATTTTTPQTITTTPTTTKTTTATHTSSITTINQTSTPVLTSASSKSPTYTSANTTTANITTTTPSGGAGFPTIVVVFIVIIIVLLILGYVLFKMRLGKLGESKQQIVSSKISRGGSGELVIKEPGSIDERDKLILEKIVDKSMTISELARETGLSKSTVWRRVRKLEKEGYVTTRGEGKYTYVEITDKGRNILDQH